MPSEQSIQAAAMVLVTLDEAARRIGRRKKTLQNWIYEGLLKGDNGLCYVGPPDHQRPMIDWTLFSVVFVRRAA